MKIDLVLAQYRREQLNFNAWIDWKYCFQDGKSQIFGKHVLICDYDDKYERHNWKSLNQIQMRKIYDKKQLLILFEAVSR
jgi:hypothetical protein